MSRERVLEYRPFLSLLIVIATLLGVVFFKMEIRRVGYSVLKAAREEHRLRDQQRQKVVRLARILRPDHVQSVAQSRLTLRKAVSGEIIQMSGDGVALRQ